QCGGGFSDGQLAALLALALAVGRDAMALADCTYPRSSPGLFVRRTVPQAIDRRRDALVGLQAGQRGDQLDRFGAGDAAMPASWRLLQPQLGVIAALP